MGICLYTKHPKRPVQRKFDGFPNDRVIQSHDWIRALSRHKKKTGDFLPRHFAVIRSRSVAYIRPTPPGTTNRRKDRPLKAWQSLPFLLSFIPTDQTPVRVVALDFVNRLFTFGTRQACGAFVRHPSSRDINVVNVLFTGARERVPFLF